MSKVTGKRKRDQTKNNKQTLSVAEQTAKLETDKIKKESRVPSDSAYLQVYRLISGYIQRGNESFAAGVELILSYVGCSIEDDYVFVVSDYNDGNKNNACVYSSRRRRVCGQYSRLVLKDVVTILSSEFTAESVPAQRARFTVMDGLPLRPLLLPPPPPPSRPSILPTLPIGVMSIGSRHQKKVDEMMFYTVEENYQLKGHFWSESSYRTLMTVPGRCGSRYGYEVGRLVQKPDLQHVSFEFNNDGRVYYLR